jgi:hypothetical protein
MLIASIIGVIASREAAKQSHYRRQKIASSLSFDFATLGMHSSQ